MGEVSVQESSTVQYLEDKSQRHLAMNPAMKALEPIQLQTAGFVHACQHLLDLFTCHSQMFLSIQSPTEAGGCTFPKHSLSKPQGFIDPGIDRRQHIANTITVERLAFTAGLPSSAGGRGEKPGSFAQ